jgi:MFS family permease
MAVDLKLYLIIFASFFDLFVQLPIISSFSSSLGASSAILVGISVGIYSLFSMTGNFLTGMVVKKVSPKKCIIFGFFLGSIFVMMYGFSATIYQLIILRSLHGLSMSLVNPCSYAMLSKVVKDNQKARKMAVSGISVGVASILGPFVGGFGTQIFGYSGAFYLVGATLLVGLLVTLTLPETYKEEVEKGKPPAFNITGVLPGYITIFGLMFAKGTLMLKLPLLGEEFGLSKGLTGMLFSTFAIVAILIFASPLGRISDKVGRLSPMAYSLGGISFVALVMAFVTKSYMLFVLMVIWGIAFGVLFPSAASFIMDTTDKGTRGRAFGIFYGVFSLGALLGPVTTAFINQMTGIPELLSASIVAILSIIVILIIKPVPQPATA